MRSNPCVQYHTNIARENWFASRELQVRAHQHISTGRELQGPDVLAHPATVVAETRHYVVFSLSTAIDAVVPGWLTCSSELRERQRRLGGVACFHQQWNLPGAAVCFTKSLDCSEQHYIQNIQFHIFLSEKRCGSAETSPV